MKEAKRYNLSCEFSFKKNPLEQLFEQTIHADPNDLFPNLVFDFDIAGVYDGTMYFIIDQLWFEHVGELETGKGHIEIETTEEITPKFLQEVSEFIMHNNFSIYLIFERIRKLQVVFSGFTLLEK
jgi:hypothetical protein